MPKAAKAEKIKEKHPPEFMLADLKLQVTHDEEAYDEYRYYRSEEGRKRLAEMKDGRYMPDLSIEVRKSGNTKIDRYLEKCKTFTYTYDFGDGWTHKVELVNVVEDYPVGYPRVLAAAGNCPPEDCGGVPVMRSFCRPGTIPATRRCANGVRSRATVSMIWCG